jgi:hypothetical protein
MSSYAEETHWDRIRSPVLDLVYLSQPLRIILWTNGSGSISV